MGGQRIQLFQTNNGDCPYRKSGVWENLSFYADELSDSAYAALLDQGFRRSGNSVYHPICHNCESCIPIRVDVNRFAPSKSQRRTWRRNQDLRVVMVLLRGHIRAQSAGTIRIPGWKRKTFTSF